MSDDQPIFDLTRPDCMYLAMILGTYDIQSGPVEILSMLYDNNGIKVTSRVTFPSGQRMLAKRSFGGILEAGGEISIQTGNQVVLELFRRLNLEKPS